MQRIADLDAPTVADEVRFSQLNAEFQATRMTGRQSSRNERRSALLNVPDRESGTSYTGAVETRDDAHRTLDSLQRSGYLPDRPADALTALVDNGSHWARRDASEYIRTVGSPQYLSAFRKLFSGPRGDMLWTPEERQAFAAVEEYRAMAIGAGSTGGFMVPLSLDPSIMITNGGVFSPLRETARVVTTVTNSWNGVTSEGVTVDVQAEAAEVNDNSPTLGQVTIETHRINCFVPYSIEAEMDAPGFIQEMSRLMLDAVEVKEAQLFTTGTGSGQPQGVITGLAGGPSVVTGTGEAFTSPQVFALQAALPPRFSANAAWYGNVSTLNAISQFETANGARVFPGVDVSPSTLLRKPLYELSTMDGVINPATTESNHVLLYGDMQQAFTIVDRLGSTIEGIQTLFGANRRPTGQRGLVLWKRVGSEVVVPNAARLLNVPTAA
jgi:HK97 family phage major capsid protein